MKIFIDRRSIVCFKHYTHIKYILINLLENREVIHSVCGVGFAGGRGAECNLTDREKVELTLSCEYERKRNSEED